MKEIQQIEQQEYKGMEIVRLFLEKLELLTPQERQIISKTIDYLNHPIFISN